MNVITVSREYGAGGGETARKIAEALNWKLLDRELLHEAAAIEHVPDAEIERLDEQAIRLLDRLSFHPAHKRYMHGLTEAVKRAAGDGNVVLVGRGTRQILGDLPDAFHLRLVAPREWRAVRMARREGWSVDQALAKCHQVDRTRQRFNAYFFAANDDAPHQYDLVVNTSRMSLDEIAELVKTLVRNNWPTSTPAPMGRRVLTVARELGSGELTFPQVLGERLELEVYDRELLEREAVKMGVAESELELVDTEVANAKQLRDPGSLAKRYYDALGRFMHSLISRNDVLLVGRGASRFLSEHLLALHIRLVATPDVRLKRVMQNKWVKEDDARKLMVASDTMRRSYYKSFFGAEWSDPLEYHLTLNTGRLGASAVDLVMMAASRFWGRS